MTTENTNNEDTTQDQVSETANFVTSSNDLPNAFSNTQDETAKEDSTSDEVVDTESVEQKAEGKEEDAGTDTPAPPKKQNNGQKRINKLVREREEAKREADKVKAELEELKAEKAEEKPKGKDPQEADFDTYDEYLDAVEQHEEGQKKEVPAKEETKEPEESKETGTLTESQKVAIAVVREMVDASEKPDDFDKVALNPEVPITGDMLEALSECDDPASIMYHLGQNKDLATEIAGKTALQQQKAIFKLELAAAKEKPPKPNKLTDAPEPITPVKGGDATEKNESEMDFSEYEAKRNEEIRKSSGGW